MRSIAHDEGMKRYLWANQVLLKDLGSHVERVSRRLKEASMAEAEALGRPVKYLPSSQVSKEEIARGIAAQERIQDVLACGFMNARIQTWFPFPVQICLNGREWLARQMEAAGLEYARQDK